MTDKLTPKQDAFLVAYLETGNASEAYRRAYNAEGMASSTINKRASELLQHGEIAGRIAELQAAAADKALLSRTWVLERLMKNARVCLGEEKVKFSVKPAKKDDLPFEVEMIMRDAAAANKALELLGKTDEARVFVERVEHTGKDGEALMPEASPRDMARAVLDILRTAKVEEKPDDAA